MIGSITNWFMTRGDSQSAWHRCLPIWHRERRIEDRRRVIGRPFYSPSRGIRLARVFAKRHSSDVSFFLEQTQSADSITALCAIDLLVQMAIVSPQITTILVSSVLPIAESLAETLESDAEVAERPLGNPTPAFDTVGSYFRWQFASHDETVSE